MLLVSLELLLLLLHGFLHLLPGHHHPRGPPHPHHRRRFPVTTTTTPLPERVGVGVLRGGPVLRLTLTLTLHGLRPHLHVLHALQRGRGRSGGGGDGALDRLERLERGGSCPPSSPSSSSSSASPSLLHLALEAHLDAGGSRLRGAAAGAAAPTPAVAVGSLDTPEGGGHLGGHPGDRR